MQTLFWADTFFNLVISRENLLVETLLEREVDVFSVSSVEFKKTRSLDSIVPMRLYALHRNSRNANYKNIIVIRFVLTFILLYYFINRM